MADHLDHAGWSLLARNLHVGRSELDLVALDPGPPQRLVAVEVRWRSGRDFGVPEETFDRRKRGRVLAGLLALVTAGRLPDGSVLPRAPAAVDLIVVEPSDGGQGSSVRLRHHRNVG